MDIHIVQTGRFLDRWKEESEGNTMVASIPSQSAQGPIYHQPKISGRLDNRWNQNRILRLTAIVTIHAVIFIVDAIISPTHATPINYNAFMLIGIDERQKLLLFDVVFMHSWVKSTFGEEQQLLVPTRRSQRRMTMGNQQIGEWRCGD